MTTKESGDEKAETDTKREATKTVDRYGFYVSDDFHTSLLVSKEESALRKEKEAERTTKWIKMVKNWNGVIINRKEKLKRRIRKGIPDHVRGFVWTKISEASTYSAKYPNLSAIDVITLDELTVDEVVLLSDFDKSHFYGMLRHLLHRLLAVVDHEGLPRYLHNFIMRMRTHLFDSLNLSRTWVTFILAIVF